MTIKIMKKKPKRNPTDSTLRNVSAVSKKLASLEHWQMLVVDTLARLEVRILKLETRLNNIDCYKDRRS